MKREIKRGGPFPPRYGHELPLPSDFEADSREVSVRSLEALWLILRRRRLSPPEVENVINSFFGSLPEQVRDWLEGDDPRWDKPRGVLVKVRAIQIDQRGEAELRLAELQEKYPGVVEGINDLIERTLESEKEPVLKESS